MSVQQPNSTHSAPAISSGITTSVALFLRESSGDTGSGSGKAFSQRGRGPTALEAESWRLLGDTSERLRWRKESLQVAGL